MNAWDRVIAAAIARRSELGLTQKELALKADVAERTIQNLEGGKRPQPLIRGKIEKALGWPSGEMERLASAPEARPEPVPELDDDPETLAALRSAYRDNPEMVREAAKSLVDAEASGRPGEDASLSGRRAS